MFPSKNISKIREKNEYFRIIFENLLFDVILKIMFNAKKMMIAIGIDETINKNPPFSRKFILSYPSL